MTFFHTVTHGNHADHGAVHVHDGHVADALVHHILHNLDDSVRGAGGDELAVGTVGHDLLNLGVERRLALHNHLGQVVCVAALCTVC